MPTKLYNANWVASSDCVRLIKEFEGLYLKAYQGDEDRPGVITIGWGSVMYQNGQKVQLVDTITPEKANALLLWEIGLKATAVSGMLQNCRVSQNQVDALVSFSYNEGIAALQGSTLLKKLRVNPDDPALENEFAKWKYSNGKIQPGLIRRRKSEWHLYSTGELEFFD